MAEVREEAARAAPGPERDAALRVLRGRALARKGFGHYSEGRRISAFACYARAYAMLSPIRRSPLTGSQLPFGMLKCLLGSRAVHILRRLGRAPRLLAGRGRSAGPAPGIERGRAAVIE